MMVGMVMMVGMMVGVVARGPDSTVPPTPPRCPRQPGDDLDEAALVAAGVLHGPSHRTLNVPLVCEVLAYMRSEETLVHAMASPRSSQHPDIAALLREVDLLAETRAVLVAPPSSSMPSRSPPPPASPVIPTMTTTDGAGVPGEPGHIPAVDCDGCGCDVAWGKTLTFFDYVRALRHFVACVPCFFVFWGGSCVMRRTRLTMLF